jgi:hypothetical protein
MRTVAPPPKYTFPFIDFSAAARYFWIVSKGASNGIELWLKKTAGTQSAFARLAWKHEPLCLFHAFIQGSEPISPRR